MANNIIGGTGALATIIAKQMLSRLNANLVLAARVSKDWSSEVATRGQTVSIVKRGAVSVNDKAAGSDVTLQSLDSSKQDVTLNKHKEVSFLIEDITRALATPDLLAGYMSDAAAALAEAIETDLAGEYTNFTGTAVDAVGVAGPVAKAHIISARKALTIAKAPMADRFLVLGANAEADLLAEPAYLNRDFRSAAETPAGVTGQLGAFFGFDVATSQLVKVATSVEKSMAFHRQAITLVTRPLPAPESPGVISHIEQLNGVGIRVMMAYDIIKGGWVVVSDVLYGIKTVRPELGVVISR